ncbi:hypothetical protein BEN47_10135 [Hymenobacter lapidarius]|uniref:Uncharacterized protein n=2 Tax=Hymenobacter lapidarius TaxID=1908237 RepID=A0A1G1TAJ3_9BACT|nr:hypothetical protein BEN47_10135 [Hymenobacter lapidarius]
MLVLAKGMAVHGQGNVKEITPAKLQQMRSAAAGSGADSQVVNLVNKGVDFGVSLGFNRVFERIYDVHVSPLDYKLKVTDAPASTFLLSMGLSVPLTRIREKPAKSTSAHVRGRYYRKLTETGGATKTVYYVPYGWNLVATVNLLTFNTAATGSVFNKRIDGGLGLGYRINDELQLAATFEMISYRLPRDFLIDECRDKQVISATGTLITSILPDNSDYYADRYLPSVSLKLFYLLAYKPLKQ